MYVFLYAYKKQQPVTHCITGCYGVVLAPPSGLEPETL